jgi:glutathione S-transferase
MFKLYYAPGACSLVPHAALEAVKAATGADFEPQLVKFHKGENKTPEFLAMNPNGQVPVLMVDGQPLTQVPAIGDYLDRRFPAAQLLPADPWQRARAMALLAWMSNSVHPTFTHVFRPEKFIDTEAAQAEVRRFNLSVYAKLMERMQGLAAEAAPWLAGAHPTLADYYALVLFRWAGLGGIDPDTLPAYRDYAARVAALPPMAAALAREGLPLSMYKKPA